MRIKVNPIDKCCDNPDIRIRYYRPIGENRLVQYLYCLNCGKIYTENVRPGLSIGGLDDALEHQKQYGSEFE